jgi:hypothetical protein
VSDFIKELLTAHPTIAAVVVFGSLLIGAANAGQAIETLRGLWRKWLRPVPPLDATWQGTWKTPRGYVFSFVMQLEVSRSNAAQGEILWRLLEAPVGSFLAPRLNDEAIEYVSGSYDRNARVAELYGHRVSDPTFLATDHYKLQILDDKVSFVAMTRDNSGKWDATAKGSVIVASKTNK